MIFKALRNEAKVVYLTLQISEPLFFSRISQIIFGQTKILSPYRESESCSFELRD